MLAGVASRLLSRRGVGTTPLLAASLAKASSVQGYLAHKSASDSNGISPLRAAALGGHDAVMQILLEAGADFSAKDLAGKTPLHSSALHGHGGRVLLEWVSTSELEVTLNPEPSTLTTTPYTLKPKP